MATNPFDQFDAAPATSAVAANPFDVFDAPKKNVNAEGMPLARQPDFAQTSPNLYEAATTAREYLGPLIEAGGSIAGGALGTFLGPLGTVAGAGLGYGISQELLQHADVALGRKAPRTPYQMVLEPVQNVMEGAAFEGLAGPVVRGAAKILDIGKKNALKAKDIAVQTLGGIDVPAFKNMLIKGGSDVTPAQATESVGKTSWQALNERVSNRTVSSADVKFATQEAQEAARQQGIKNVTPDLAQSIKDRELMSKPFYDLSDKAVVQLDQAMQTLFGRMPEGTLKKAAEIARMEKRRFVMGQNVPAQQVPSGLLNASGNPIMKNIPEQIAKITGESMHFIKRALSDLANAPASTQGIGRDTQAAAKGVLNDFVKEFETRVPAYGDARKMFADFSQPVNQAKVLDTMMKVLEQPGGGERVLPFLNVLGRGETALLKKSTGFPRYESGDLRKILTPDQMTAVDDAVSQMTRDIRISDQAANGREALRDVLSENLKMLRLPSLINFKATVANALMDQIEKKVGKGVMDTLTESLKTAKTADELFSVLPAHERIKVVKIVNDVASNSNLAQRAIRSGVNATETGKVSDAVGALFSEGANVFYPKNKFNPQQENRNALTQ